MGKATVDREGVDKSRGGETIRQGEYTRNAQTKKRIGYLRDKAHQNLNSTKSRSLKALQDP